MEPMWNIALINAAIKSTHYTWGKCKERSKLKNKGKAKLNVIKSNVLESKSDTFTCEVVLENIRKSIC